MRLPQGCLRVRVGRSAGATRLVSVHEPQDLRPEFVRRPARGLPWPFVGYGAAQESNLPSVGLPRLTGFEDRLGHRAPPLRCERSHAGSSMRAKSRSVTCTRRPPRLRAIPKRLDRPATASPREYMPAGRCPCRFVMRKTDWLGRAMSSQRLGDVVRGFFASPCGDAARRGCRQRTATERRGSFHRVARDGGVGGLVGTRASRGGGSSPHADDRDATRLAYRSCARSTPS